MKLNLLFFPDFETLDVFGPVEIFGQLEDLQLQYVSLTGGIVRSHQKAAIVTQPLLESDDDCVLFLPGGMGTRVLVEDLDFIRRLSQAAEVSRYCLTVCTGSALLAQTGLLDGRRATTNKRSYQWATAQRAAVNWQASARWVTDGKFYTSSGVSAGMDMALGFVADLYGKAAAKTIACRIEYIWQQNPEQDAFAVK
ncbi:MAG: DJ-1/PfpI family protein [Negativicutes bacterium]|nr:DJ-1/PfpI family protein [Negativicutes bacterium]